MPNRLTSWASRVFNNLGRTKPTEGSERYVYMHPGTASGVYVTPDSALKQATVWACINYLSRMVAQLPWHVMLEDKINGGAQVQSTHPVNWLLNTRPSPDMGSFTFRQSMLGTALAWGNSYAEIERDYRGVPVWLWYIHPSRVSVSRGADGFLQYKVSNSRSEPVTLDASEMFHIRGFGDGPVGMPVIEYAAQSIGWAQATELFGASYFGEGMNPTGIIQVDKGLSPEAMVLLRKELEKVYTGPKAKRTAILDAGMTWTKVTNDPESSQFNETSMFQVEQICRFFGVPPHKVQHLLRSTFSNIESQNIEVVVDTLTPWVKVFEEEANFKLFGQNRFGYFTKMSLNGLLRGDSQGRAALYKVMFELGALSPNELLLLEDRNPIGPDGDTRFVSNNVQTLENAMRAKVDTVSPTRQPDPGSDDNGDPLNYIRNLDTPRVLNFLDDDNG